MMRCGLRSVAAVCLVSAGVSAGVGTRPLAEGLHGQVLPLFRELEGGGVANLGIVGDSVSLLEGSYNWHLRRRFWDEYGSAGDGYMALTRFNGTCQANREGPRCGLLRTVGPGATFSEDTGPFDEFGQFAPDGMWYRLAAGLSPATSTFAVFGREVVLHYQRRVGGGVMEVELNGQLIQTIDTAIVAGEAEHARFVIDTGVDDADVLSSVRLRVMTAAPVYVHAFEMRSASGGLRYHRLARGGAGPGMYLGSRTGAVADGLRSLELDLLIVMLDGAGAEGTDVALYEANLDALVSFYQAELPGVKLVLMTHHPFRTIIGPQADAILRVARDRGTGYINLFDVFSGFEEMDALGYMSGVVHLTNAGGAFFGQYVYDLLKSAGDEALVADFNGDGLFDFFDLLSFLGALSAGEPSADVNGDGQFDFFDVVEFLSAFSAAGG